jgi:hypothetical protein
VCKYYGVIESRENAKPNPLDALMTPAQIARKKFKAALPRKIRNTVLSKLEAMARTMELIDGLRTCMLREGCSPGDVGAGLIFTQPETPSLESFARTIWLPGPEKVGVFVEAIMKLDRPLFLGLLFWQHDSKAEKEEKREVAFLWPFMGGPLAEKHLLTARNHFAKGGHKMLDN